MEPPPLPRIFSRNSITQQSDSPDHRNRTSEFALRLTGIAAVILLGGVFLFLILNYVRSLSFKLPVQKQPTTSIAIEAKLDDGDKPTGQSETGVADSTQSKNNSPRTPFGANTPDTAPVFDSEVIQDGNDIVGELRVYNSGDRSISTEEGSGINPFASQSDSVRSVVFVIDVSSSMNSQERLPRVTDSLKEAIEELRDDQKFNILLFRDQFMSFSRTHGLVRASARLKRDAFDYLDTTFATGGTNPLPAIISAISVNPERIVVLSDGEFDPLVVENATHFNQSKKQPATIDCIGVDEQVQVLRDLASKNGGVYFQAK